MSQTIPPSGKIILLNGASSSGKSTLARALQARMDSPFFILSSDLLVDGGALPPQRDRNYDIHNEFSWTAVMRPKFFSGFHGCIRAMALAGNNLIVDHIIEYPEWVTELQRVLIGLDVWVAAVHCDIAELERREIARGDRTVGEGKAHLEQNRIHELVQYHYEIDTTKPLSESNLTGMIGSWNSRNVQDAKLSRRQ